MIYLGVDPGASGGITAIGTGGVTTVVSMPTTEKALWALVGSWGNVRDVVCVLERVHAMPHDGVSSAFKFGASYGGLRMALVAAGVPFVAETPQTWQAYFGLLKLPDESSSAHKTRIGTHAKLRYPDVKVPRSAYDSVFLALYAQLNYPRGL